MREPFQGPQVPPPLPLPLEQDHVLDEGGDQARHLAQGLEVAGLEALGGQPGRDYRSDDAATAFQGNQEPRADPRFLQPLFEGIDRRETRIGREVVDQHGLASEHVPQGPFGHDVPLAAAECRGVVLLVEREGRGGVLGEDREGAAVLVQKIDDQTVVGDQPLELGGEVAEEAPGVELLAVGIYRPRGTRVNA